MEPLFLPECRDATDPQEQNTRIHTHTRDQKGNPHKISSQEDGGFQTAPDPVSEIDTHVQNRTRELPVCSGRRCSRAGSCPHLGFPQLP